MQICCKSYHIFSAKNIRILYIESAKTVNEMTLNELVKLTTFWTTWAWSIVFLISPQKHILWVCSKCHGPHHMFCGEIRQISILFGWKRHHIWSYDSSLYWSWYFVRLSQLMIQMKRQSLPSIAHDMYGIQTIVTKLGILIWSALVMVKIKVKKGLPLETKNTQNHENQRLGLIESLHMQHCSLRGCIRP